MCLSMNMCQNMSCESVMCQNYTDQTSVIQKEHDRQKLVGSDTDLVNFTLKCTGLQVQINIQASNS